MKSSFVKFACLSLAMPLLSFAEVTQPSRHATQIHEDKSEDMTVEHPMITPSVMPVIDHGYNVFVTADFIYWTGRTDNLDYAQTGTALVSSRALFNGTTNANVTSEEGTQWHPHHKMSPGFKLGIGCDLNHDGWDTYFHYTWLRNSASSTESFTTAAVSLWDYAPIAVYSRSTTTINAAAAAWKLHFNTLDWELGREFYISPRLLLRPHFGLKGSWQSQHNNVDFSSLTDINLTGDSATGSYNMTQKQTFWGVGIRSGLDTSWKFTRSWSLFGDISLAALWSQFTTHRTDVLTQIGSSSRINTFTNLEAIHLRRLTHTITPVIEWDLGVRFDYWFSDEDYRFRVQAAWEQQVWFDHNQYLQLDNTNRTGSLNLQGLTLDFRFDF